MTRNTEILLAVLLAAMLITACSQDADTKIAAESAIKKTISKGSPGKPGAPVSINHSIAGVMAVGETIAVQLNVVPNVNTVKLFLNVSTTDGLQITSTSNEASFDNIAAGAPVNYSVDVVPQANGLFYLNVFVTIESDGTRATKIQAIPIKVGPKGQKPALKAVGVIEAGESGEKTINLPMDVTIKNK